MAKMLLEGDVARALSVLGGRNLVKTGELLAGSLAPLLNAKTLSDGVQVTLTTDDSSLSLIPQGGQPVLRGKYYVYQKGSFLIEGQKRVLDQTKLLLLKLAEERKHYLLSRYSNEQLEEYGLDINFITSLDKQVSELMVEE
ncbi:hypothetical protein K8R43_02485 [archaeon]|nr:hypothetical protein [archaeon]